MSGKRRKRGGHRVRLAGSWVDAELDYLYDGEKDVRLRSGRGWQEDFLLNLPNGEEEASGFSGPLRREASERRKEAGL